KFSFVCSNRQAVLAFTADGRTLIVNPYDPVLYRYETATGRRLFQAGEEGGWFFDLAFAADGRSLYTLSTDGTLGHWEAATGKPIRKTPVAAIYGLFSPDGRLAAVSRAEGVRVYETATGRERWHSSERNVHRFSDDGQLLALSAGVELVLREPASGQERQRLRGAATPTNGIVFSPDS